ncbi:hypothetical protein RHODGE_RHODGE_04594 [Rhodoplanes serenus]|uniref:Uncharacterized protein n=1 Tax=Rhodoplanes serenus TaxID=200615 RepID=A0A447D1H8_9BRAD|nr:hypothetical protein [Rhodoplanes serenus]VCU11383.1 hypothetical protein RHODGE_RHODGE_04594 [Rhodoplanes serenus]
MTTKARSGETLRPAGGEPVIIRRELPGKVVVRTLRPDVFRSALRAAETTLRAQRRAPRLTDKK